MRKYLIMFGALVCMATLWADNVRFAVDGPRQKFVSQPAMGYQYYSYHLFFSAFPDFNGAKRFNDFLFAFNAFQFVGTGLTAFE